MCVCVCVQAAQASMETHTLARYISESTLQDYSFVTEYPSLVAAAAMYLALRMKKLGPWVSQTSCPARGGNNRWMSTHYYFSLFV